MQSPKFKFLLGSLNETFDRSLLEEEWKTRVSYQIRKQRVLDAIEYRDYKVELRELIDALRHDILSGTYQTKQPKRYLVEKSRGLCRQMTLVHPRDLLVLERLARSLYFEIKGSAPSKSAFFEPDDGNFKAGFQQSDFDYGSFASWKKFQSAVFGFADENKFIVVTDVANFYDFINFQHLRNIVSSIAEVREALLDLLIFMLNKLTWTPDFMPLSQVGMPQIETTATRVLANALLYEIDRVAEDRSVENYARFMDDIDVGVDSISMAKELIRDLDLTLQSRQLRLNSAKTKILSQDDAFEHFCISENRTLARLEEMQERFGPHRLLKRAARDQYEKWLCRGPKGDPGKGSVFRRPNGSKIHKWSMRFLFQLDEQVPENDLLWLIRNEPGMRTAAFRYLAASKRNNTNLSTLARVVKNGLFVDDAAFVDLAGYLLHARFRRTRKCDTTVRDLVEMMARASDIGLHGAILVSSRLQKPEDILELLGRNRDRIKSDFWLARVSAGILPRFLSSVADLGSFKEFVWSLGNDDAERVLGYHMELATTKNLSQSNKAYLKSPNKSFPQGVYFPKVLAALALAQNKDQTAFIKEVYATHAALLSDPYYSSMGF